MFHIHKAMVWTFLLAAGTSGCDERATQIAREAADRQAQQNTAMAELNREVASGTHRLVEADAQARQGFVGVHRDLQAERSRLDTGWTNLEQERKQLASQRRVESMLVPATTLVGGALVVLLLLGFAWYALVATHASDDTSGPLQEFLLTELALPDRPALDDQSIRVPLPPAQGPDADHQPTASFAKEL
jgi:hypothetical protein